jgi:hypothetical protein
MSDPLKGEDGYIKKFNRRKGRVAVDFLLGTERHKIWLAVRLLENADNSLNQSKCDLHFLSVVIILRL